MAKDDDLNWDEDDMMDDDFGDFEAEFGMAEPPPPKNKREAATRSLKDAGDGVLGSFKNDDPMGKAAEAAKSAIPSSLSSEASQIADLHVSLKEKYDSSIKEVKQSARVATNALDSIVPDSGMARKALDKIKNKLGSEESAEREESKEEIQAANITSAMSEVFREQNKAEQVKDLVNSAVEEIRHKSQSDILANISANVEQTRKFNFEITNAYYRRSLELQYKSLFTAKEQLEVLKTGIDTFSNQFESIVNNTALPDILKTRRNEALKESLAEAGRQKISDLFYSEKNPINVFKTNAIAKMANVASAVTGGLDAVTAGAEQKAGMDEMSGMGVSKANMIGGMVGDGIRSKIASTLGNRFAKTDSGKDGIFNIKNAMADLPSYFREQSSVASGKEGMLNTAKSKLFGFLGDMSTSKEDNDVTFVKKDLDEVTAFDNRAHSSIVKIIPGLLSKIYGEVKSIRTKDGDPESNELTYDHNNNKFTTKKDTADTIKSDIANRLNRGANNYFESILGKLEETSGYTVPKNDMADVRASFFMHLLNGGKLSSGSLVEADFISQLPKSQRKPFKEAAEKLLAEAKQDPSLLDSINNDIKSTKFSLPNINKELMDMHASGENDVAMSMGVMKQDERTKEFMTDKEGMKQFLVDASKDISSDDIEHEKRYRTKIEKEKEELKSDFDKSIEFFKSKTTALKDKYGNKLKENVPDVLKPTNISAKAKSGYGTAKKYATDKEYRQSTNEQFNKNVADYYKDVKKKATSTKDSLTTMLKESEVSDETMAEIENLEIRKESGGISAVDYIKDRATIFARESKISNFSKKAGKVVSEEATAFSKKHDIDGKLNQVKTTANTKLDATKKYVTEKTNATKAWLYKNLTSKQKKKIKAAGMRLEDIKNFSSPYAEEALRRAGLIYDTASGELMDIANKTTAFAIDKDYRTQTISDAKRVYGGTKENVVSYATDSDFRTKTNNAVKEDVTLGLNSAKNALMTNATSAKNAMTVGVSGMKTEATAKISKTMEERNALKTLTLEEEETFRTQFFNSDEYQSKAVTSFDEYLTSLGYRREDNLDVIKKHTDQISKSAKDKFIEQFGDPKKAFTNKFNEIFNGKKETPPEEDLKQEFLNSEEFKNGTVKTFDEWKLALGKESEEDKKGKSAYNKINKFFKKTRSFERKMIGGAFKKVFGKKEKEYDEENNKIKNKGLLRKGLGLAGGGAKVGAKTLGAMFGVYGNDQDDAYGKINKGMKGTRSAEIGILGSLFKKNKKEEENTEKLTSTLEKIDKKLDKDNKKPSFNDKDGDGVREGSWKDKLKSVNDVDDPKTSMRDKMKNIGKGLMKNKGLAASGILLGLLAAGKAMGVTMDDVKGFAKGVWDGVKTVGKLLGGVWDVLKTIWKGVEKGFGYMKDGFNYLKTVPDAISLSVRRALPSFAGGISEEEAEKEQAILDAKRKGTYVEPDKFDENGNPIPQDTDSSSYAGETATYTGAGLVGAYAARKTFNGARRVYKGGKAVVNAGVKTAKVTKNVADKVRGKPTTPKVNKTAIEKAKPKTGKVMSFLKSLKGKIVKKFGKKGSVKVLAKLAGKIAARAVPFVGVGILAYDAFMIAKYMVSNDMDFKSAASKAILGFDLFADDDLPKDENGEPIKPTADEEAADDSSSVENSETNSTAGGSSFSSDSKNGTMASKAVNNVGYKPQPNIIKPVDESIDTTVDLGNNPRNRDEVKQLLDRVGSKTGVDPSTLKIFAAMESGMDPNAKASTSSASGLFQFIKNTWKNIVGKHGDKYGIPKGTSPFVAEANATMGAEFLKDNAKIVGSVKPNVQTVDLYLAHFLGAAGAKKFLRSDPNAIASKLFPAAANANKSIFFTPDGTPRTIGEVYQLFNKKVIRKAKNYGITLNGEENVRLDNNTSSNTNISYAASNTTMGRSNGGNEQDWYAKQQARKNSSVDKETSSGQQGFKTKQTAQETISSAKAKQETITQKSKTENVTMEQGKASAERLSTIDSTLKESLNVQIRMANTLDQILAATTSNEDLKKEAQKEAEKNKPANNTTPVKTSMPKPAVDIKRRSYI